jgi:hypothetical protein
VRAEWSRGRPWKQPCRGVGFLLVGEGHNHFGGSWGCSFVQPISLYAVK